MARRKKTKTSEFGVSGRISHDSTPFYSRKMYKDLELPKPSKKDMIENPVPLEYLDKLIVGDARNVLKKLPDNCVHLVITSPPYNVGKKYDEDLTLQEYLDFIEEILREIYRVLVWGGRVCFNVANLGRKPYIPLHAYVIQIFEKIGYLMRGEIIWYKGNSIAGSSTAWGSWQSATNPVLRDVHEYILVFSKGSFKREKNGKKETISRDEFIEFTRSVWTFPPASAKEIRHPAPFPIELPYRCIQLYTFEGDVVLDPFVGSGTTCIAAIMLKRYYIGIDINEEYIRLAQNRISQFLARKKLTEF